MNFTDLYDGMDITIQDPFTKERCVGTLEAYEFPNETGTAFIAKWEISGFPSNTEIKDQSDVEQFKIKAL